MNINKNKYGLSNVGSNSEEEFMIKLQVPKPKQFKLIVDYQYYNFDF